MSLPQLFAKLQWNQLQTLHLSCYVMMYPHKVWMLTHHFERWAMGIGIDIR